MKHDRFILSSQIIGKQLIRNMGLAFAVIALVSLLLIADPIVRWADEKRVAQLDYPENVLAD